MLVMVEERALVLAGYEHGFAAEGMALVGFAPADFMTWIETAPAAELAAVEAVLLGDGGERLACARAVARRANVPTLAMVDATSLDATLSLFAEGVDDVVRKPVHVREIVARIGAIRRRSAYVGRALAPAPATDAVSVFYDGRDPEIGGVALELPRRERRILEYLIANQGRRVTKSQIFNAIYGIYDDNVEENVVESHVSKLRKKLRARLGYDPVDSKRFLGYCIELKGAPMQSDDAVPARQAA